MPTRVTDLDRVTRFFLTAADAEARIAKTVVDSIMKSRFGTRQTEKKPKKARAKPEQEPV